MGMKGTVMRVLHERLDGRDVDTTDGIKVFDERGGRRCCPIPTSRSCTSTRRGDEEDSASLLDELRSLVEEIVQQQEALATP